MLTPLRKLQPVFSGHQRQHKNLPGVRSQLHGTAVAPREWDGATCAAPLTAACVAVGPDTATEA